MLLKANGDEGMPITIVAEMVTAWAWGETPKGDPVLLVFIKDGAAAKFLEPQASWMDRMLTQVHPDVRTFSEQS